MHESTRFTLIIHSTLVTSKASNFYFTGISYITVYRKEIIFKSRKFYTDRFSNNFNLINYFIINIFKVNLYDELRQVLFIVPIFFIISLSVIYFYKKKLAYIIVLSYIVLFIFQNFKIFPYNYLWLNSISNYTQVTNNFERDYWGVSTFNLANYFKNNLPKKK